MKEFKYVVTDAQGIHARPAGILVKAIAKKTSDIKIKKAGLMGLGAKKDHEVTFTFEGADEEAACEAVSKFMQENL